MKIGLARIEESRRALAALAQVLIIEGVGGFKVPLGADGDTADLAARLALPVVLVVGMRLGCLNHALLTAEAIAARGLELAGWIANHIDPDMEAADDNVRSIGRLFAAPLLARIAHATAPQAAAVAASLATRRLVP